VRITATGTPQKSEPYQGLPNLRTEFLNEEEARKKGFTVGKDHGSQDE
jgi:hypothetical protein